MVKIAPSVLSANFAYLKDEIDSITQGGAEWIHYDVMDGHFVPNISFGYSILKDVSKITQLFLDIHLMISNPSQYVDAFIESGANMITFHIEAMHSVEDTRALIAHIKEANVQVGISIKPGTSIETVKPYLEDLDMVLVMSVEPGFGGQKFNPTAVSKIQELAKYKQQNHFIIQVDGGINEETGKLCRDAGVDVMVAGSYVFNQENRKKAIDSLR